MAHNLNIKENGEAAFFTVKEKAWHELGLVLDKCPTSSEAIKLAGLDYEVIKVQNKIEFPIGSGKYKDCPKSFSTVRGDNGDVFGSKLGNGYTIVQNKDAFGFFDAIVGEGEAIYETAGALGKGEVIFITAKLPSYIRVGNKDDIEKYLVLTNTHDGTGSVKCLFSPIRIVCNNTLNLALGQNKGGETRISIRHSSTVEQKLKEAHRIMKITNMLSEELEQCLNVMAKTKISDEKVLEYIEQVFTPEKKLLEIKHAKEVGNKELLEELISSRMFNKQNEIFKYYNEAESQQLDTCKGTLFGAYNSITGFFQNVKEYKSVDDKMRNNLLGNNYRTMQRALDLAVEMI